MTGHTGVEPTHMVDHAEGYYRLTIRYGSQLGVLAKTSSVGDDGASGRSEKIEVGEWRRVTQ